MNVFSIHAVCNWAEIFQHVRQGNIWVLCSGKWNWSLYMQAWWNSIPFLFVKLKAASRSTPQSGPSKQHLHKHMCNCTFQCDPDLTGIKGNFALTSVGWVIMSRLRMKWFPENGTSSVFNPVPQPDLYRNFGTVLIQIKVPCTCPNAQCSLTSLRDRSKSFLRII